MVKVIDASYLSEKLCTSRDVLLLDTRTSSDFDAGCIEGAVNVYCTGLMLRRLKKGSLPIESLLPSEEYKEMYGRAKCTESVEVVVCDKDSENAAYVDDDSLAYYLLKKLTRECKKVLFLAGGYDNFSKANGDRCICSPPPSPTCSPDHITLTSRPSSLFLRLSNISLNAAERSTFVDTPETPSYLQDVPPIQILPHLYLGCRRVAANRDSLQRENISHVLNVTAHIPNEYEDCFTYKRIAVEDAAHVDMGMYFSEAFDFIEQARRSNQKVLVHCQAGMSRSVTIILAYLMKHFGFSMEGAYDHVKARKSNIQPNFSFMGQLLDFERFLSCSPSDASGVESPSQSLVYSM